MFFGSLVTTECPVLMLLMEETVYIYEAFAANIFNKLLPTDANRWSFILAARRAVKNSRLLRKIKNCLGPGRIL
jgi:hypothetical protein